MELLEKKLKIATDCLEHLELMAPYQQEENPEITAKEVAETTSTLAKVALKRISELQ